MNPFNSVTLDSLSLITNTHFPSNVFPINSMSASRHPMMGMSRPFAAVRWTQLADDSTTSPKWFLKCDSVIVVTSDPVSKRQIVQIPAIFTSMVRQSSKALSQRDLETFSVSQSAVWLLITDGPGLSSTEVSRSAVFSISAVWDCTLLEFSLLWGQRWLVWPGLPHVF